MNYTDQIDQFKLPGDKCPQGIFVEKLCPLAANLQDLENIDCGSTVTSFKIQYMRCETKVRTRRNQVDSETWVDQTRKSLKQLEGHAIQWLKGHSFTMLVVLLIIAMRLKTPVWILTILCVVGWSVVSAQEITPFMVHSHDHTTLLKTRIYPGEAKHVSTDVGLVTFIAQPAHVFGGQELRKLATKCAVKRVFNSQHIQGFVSLHAVTFRA